MINKKVQMTHNYRIFTNPIEMFLTVTTSSLGKGAELSRGSDDNNWK